MLVYLLTLLCEIRPTPSMLMRFHKGPSEIFIYNVNIAFIHIICFHVIYHPYLIHLHLLLIVHHYSVDRRCSTPFSLHYETRFLLLSLYTLLFLIIKYVPKIPTCILISVKENVFFFLITYMICKVILPALPKIYTPTF